jgi:hypothetical protein
MDNYWQVIAERQNDGFMPDVIDFKNCHTPNEIYMTKLEFVCKYKTPPTFKGIKQQDSTIDIDNE